MSRIRQLGILLPFVLAPAVAAACSGTDPAITGSDDAGANGSDGAGTVSDAVAYDADDGLVENLLYNPGFEDRGSGCSQWNDKGTGDFTTYTADKHSGAQSCLVCSRDGIPFTAYSLAQFVNVAGPPAFVDGATYQLGAWIKLAPADAPHPASTRINAGTNLGDAYGSGEVYSHEEDFDARADWRFVSMPYTYEAMDGGSYVEIEFLVRGETAGCFLIDDVSFGLVRQ